MFSGTHINNIPLLDWCKTNFDMNLKDTLLISCHHILESNFSLLKYFMAKGLASHNIHVLGKCYSTNNEVFELYKKGNIHIHTKSNSFIPHISFQEQYTANTINFLNGIIQNIDFKNFKKVIIWDDGGELLYHINKLPQDKLKNVIGIEHTSNGFHKLKGEVLLFPIINVARSDIKLSTESPFIAELSLQNFQFSIQDIKPEIKNILIVGGGAIGSALKEKLQLTYNVDIYDIDINKSSVSGVFEEVIQNYDVIFGATGNNILTYDQFKKLKQGIILVSVSSGDYEFCTLDIRKRTIQSGIWDNLELDGKYLLNGGFPITFTGRRHAVPIKNIQLTRGLIYGAVYQIISSDLKMNGFTDFDKEIQKKICNSFLKLSK